MRTLRSNNATETRTSLKSEFEFFCLYRNDSDPDSMAEGHDISGSDNEAVWEQDTELYRVVHDGSDWQYLQLNEERLIWTSDLES